MMGPRPAAVLVALTLSALALTSCHSAFIQATVVNRSGGPVNLFEVDYPSASFGGNELADGGVFHYRFKVLGSGPAKLTWTDAARHDHAAQGPQLREGQEGSLALTIGANGATWDAHLHGP